jgi:hypothetical protein
MARGVPVKNPSCVLQAVWAYWVIVLCESTANAWAEKKMRNKNESTRAAFVDMVLVSTTTCPKIKTP